jgi:hypothetical protein
MNNEIGDQIRDILPNIPERLTLVEGEVDASVQQEYLAYTEDLDFDHCSEKDIAAKR